YLNNRDVTQVHWESFFVHYKYSSSEKQAAMSKYRQMIKEMEPNDEAIKKGLLQQFNEDKSKMNSYWSELEEKENNFLISLHVLTYYYWNEYREITPEKQSRKSQRTKLEEKDLLVAMSGIINSRMEGSNEIFGEDIVNSINKSCLLPQAHMPSVELELILEPLRIAFKAGGESGLLDQIEEFIGDDARARKAKNETSQLRAQVLDIIRY
ncbi:hypothetical protein BGZ80_005577, partial [Entomortierella chlamydospora]